MSSTATTAQSTATPTSNIAEAPSEPSTTVYKGKVSRSWAQLPDEIIRHITTHYLASISPRLFCPATWDIKELWSSRLIYTALRDAMEVEKLMSICAPWHVAIEFHPFWQHACSVLDPYERLANIVAAPPAVTAGSTKTGPPRLSPYRHYQHLSSFSCLVCRLNFPYSEHGLGTARRSVVSPYLRNVPVCKDHRKATFCAICLRMAPHDDSHLMVCCAENEDEGTWPGLEATCRSCRSEWLWKRAASNPLDREALGGHPMRWRSGAQPDWETRQAVESFVDVGEGCISDVLALARDKHWLRTNTKLTDMLSQAVAATRYVDRAEAGYDGEVSDDDLSDEDDTELLSMTEDQGGIRDLAIADWVRNRILDGHWINPADQWYGYSVAAQPFVPAEHPCPWLGRTYTGAVQDGESKGDGEELVHPRPRTYESLCPPTYNLCEHVFRTYQRVMREILLPAMTNIVRRLIMEHQVDGSDPAIRASRMSLDEVLKELRDQDTWSKGIDWVERRHLRLKQEQERRHKSEDDDTSSSRSEGSHTTSPVLSTTTLQTTPSPPPSSVKDEDAETSPVAPSSPAVVVTVPDSPSMQANQLLRPIPYVPVSIAHLPHFSMESIRMVWREACTPLYQCRCSICERAMLAANTESVNNGGNWVHNPQKVPSTPVTGQEIQSPVEVKLEEVPPHIARREEEEEAESDVDAEYSDDLDSSDYEYEKWIDDGGLKSLVEDKDRPIQMFSVAPIRKRSHEEVAEMAEEVAVDLPPPREGTPPKRARIEAPDVTPKSSTLSPPRLRKRSSEELDDGAISPKNQGGKRVKAET